MLIIYVATNLKKKEKGGEERRNINECNDVTVKGLIYSVLLKMSLYWV
jgi:hypothetical protein